MAHGLQQQALDRLASAEDASKLAAVSLEVQLSGGSWFRTAAPAPGEATPQLRVRRSAGAADAIELSVQDAQVGCCMPFICWIS